MTFPADSWQVSQYWEKGHATHLPLAFSYRPSMHGHLLLALGMRTRWSLVTQEVQTVVEVQALQPLGQVGGAHDPLVGGDPLGQVKQLLDRAPLHVVQLESQLEQRKFVVVLLTNLPAGQVQALLRAVRPPVQVRHWVAEVPEQVEQLESHTMGGLLQSPLVGA